MLSINNKLTNINTKFEVGDNVKYYNKPINSGMQGKKKGG
jgi:hypothetical protein